MKVKKVQMKKSPFSRSPVDIIIPFHDHHDQVAKLVYSILISVKSNPYQITLIDDGSKNKFFSEDFKDFDRNRPMGTDPIVKVIRSEQRLGFGGALNLGFKNTKQPYVMIMHSDCLVENPNWMVSMGESLLALKEFNVRMVAAKSQNPGPGTAKLKAEKGEFVTTNDMILNDDEFLPLYCVMAHRELFNRIGGFVKAYPYLGYEDEELAYRMKRHGYKQAVCSKAWINHTGGMTINSLIKENPEVIGVINENRNLCIEDMKKITKK